MRCAGLLALSSAIVASEALPGRRTAGCMLLYKQALLHSTLSAQDSEALYLFASQAIIPVTRAENKTTRSLQKLYSRVTDWSKGDSSPLHAASWHIATTQEHEGLLTYGTDGAARIGECPQVYLQAAHPARLVAWQSDGFLVRLPCGSCRGASGVVAAMCRPVLWRLACKHRVIPFAALCVPAWQHDRRAVARNLLTRPPGKPSQGVAAQPSARLCECCPGARGH